MKVFLPFEGGCVCVCACVCISHMHAGSAQLCLTHHSFTEPPPVSHRWVLGAFWTFLSLLHCMLSCSSDPRLWAASGSPLSHSPSFFLPRLLVCELFASITCDPGRSNNVLACVSSGQNAALDGLSRVKQRQGLGASFRRHHAGRKK